MDQIPRLIVVFFFFVCTYSVLDMLSLLFDTPVGYTGDTQLQDIHCTV